MALVPVVGEITAQGINDNFSYLNNLIIIHEANTTPHSAATNIIRCSLANVTYYVRTDGSDSNTGLANNAGGAFLTIMKAINSLPKHMNHIAFIQVAAGTYAENVLIEGFVGKGSIQLNGAGSLALAANHILNYVHYSYNSCAVYVKGFTATTTTDIGIGAMYNPGYSEIHWCRVVAAGAGRGIVNYYCNYVLMFECLVSNRSVAIYTSGGLTWGVNHTGTGNTVGLYAEKMGTYGKNGTQPGGTTAEASGAGGAIVAA